MIIKCIKSFRYAFKGIWLVIRYENNARIHTMATIIVLGLGGYFKLSQIEWLWILLAISLVWITETFNTALEKLVDFISPEFHAMAGKIKDISAGAVLMAAITSVVIGGIVFFPYLMR